MSHFGALSGHCLQHNVQMEVEVGDALSEVDWDGSVVAISLVESDAWGAADDPDDEDPVADALEDAQLLPYFLPCPLD